ncbi:MULTISPECIES: nuclear transport factor 2 family protein [Thermomonosporaceae]|uniref:nuclear transport factor 2 family protein n=1 Tax=Thermomonosporaceae TaxID=2012 RepID=UPI00255A8223|nr:MULTISPECIES: nuclear transport factor 2 family protein [Thermomonosporaceae]MDL4775441.1 nuclear transport factor 2 family protein [Actinomadura xylanilytica]
MHQALADRFFAAITGGDLDALRSVYAPGAVIWHNGPGEGGGSEQGVEDNLRTLRWLSANLRDFRYEEIRRDPMPDGFVQRHVLRGNLPGEGGGAAVAIEVATCLFATVDADGRIARIEEYADTRGSDALRAHAAAQRAARG